MKTKEKFDILIVGSGIVGMALACGLGELGFRIGVIDGNLPHKDWATDDYDLRVSAITPASRNIFKALGVWDTIEAMRISAFRQMHVWDENSDGQIHFDAHQLGIEELGYIIENRVIKKALYERLNQHDNIKLMAPVRLVSSKINDNGVELTAEDGRVFSAALLVGADGARSWVREQCGFDLKTVPYGHSALVATVETELSHESTAWQRFLAKGPLAFLPLNNTAREKNEASIVWSSTPEEIEALLAMNDDDFKKSLANAFEYKLGKIINVSQRASFPLMMRHAKQYIKPRAVLVGDAAHTFHPLAGQGLNVGLMDAAVLVDVMKAARNKQQAIHEHGILRRYERWRRAENLRMLAAVDGFKYLFTKQTGPAQWIRGLGLGLTHRCTPLKHRLIRYAMGSAGRLPDLAQ